MDETHKRGFLKRCLLFVVQLFGLTLQHVCITVACLLCLQAVCILLSRMNPWLELTVHFVVHGLLASLLIAPVLWATRHRRTAVVCLMLAFFFAVQVQPWLWLLPDADERYPESVKVLSWNVLATNEDVDEIEAVIHTSDPDILILIEVRPNLFEQIPYIQKNYPNSRVFTHWGGMGIGIFSKRADVVYEDQFFEIKVMPSIVARCTSTDGKRQVELVAMHTFSPTPPERALVRDRQLKAFETWALDREVPVCLAGDLNTTPWTRSFHALERAGFYDTRRGTGNQASWPAMLGDLGIPIDHVMTRGACRVWKRQVLPATNGSDHRPVEFELSF